MCICHVRARMSLTAFCCRYFEHVPHANFDNLLVRMWNMSTALYLAIGYACFKYFTFSANIVKRRIAHLLLLPQARFQSLSTSATIKIAQTYLAFYISNLDLFKFYR